MVLTGRPLAIYVHIPFCRSKCAYCDFASFPGREDVWKAYFSALWNEIKQAGAQAKGFYVETVFFGGGTPTVVPAEFLTKTLDVLHDTFPFAPDCEISLEGNPGTVTLDALRAYRQAGFERISFGVQAFDDAMLKSIGRIHTVREAEEAVRLAREAEFENLNLDLIYALPSQTMENWQNTLQSAVALHPEHISAYSLILEEGTPILARADEVPDDETVLAMQRYATRFLAEHGYGRYEISNYALPGRECRHNLVYWQRGDYLGFGVSAHSFFRGERFENARTLEGYLAGETTLGRETIDRDGALEEAVLLETRTVRGLDLAKFEHDFGSDALQKIEKAAAPLAKEGLLCIKDGFLRLTERGLEVQMAAVVTLLEGF